MPRDDKTRAMITAVYALLAMNAHHSKPMAAIKGQFEDAFKDELAAPHSMGFSHVRRAMQNRPGKG